MKKDMDAIASDATEGRFTGSAGYNKAARLITAELKKAGLKPAWKTSGAPAWYQPVPFFRDDYSGSFIRLGARHFSEGAVHFIVIRNGVAKSGKWIVLRAGDSISGRPAGVVRLPAAAQGVDWETTVIRQYRFGYMHYGPEWKENNTGVPEILLSPQMALRLQAQDSIEVHLVHRILKKTGINVLAIAPAMNGNRTKGVILTGAHLDHIGRIGSHIYNGANDDASGCVAELEAARWFGAHPAKKPLLFAFFCGEELGMKGSKWFATHPAKGEDKIAVSVNLEQLGSRHRSVRGVWGLGDTAFQAVFRSVGLHRYAGGDLPFSAKDTVEEILGNTDSYAFLLKKVPSLLLGSGSFPEHHTVLDKPNLIDFEQLAKSTGLLIDLLKEIATSQVWDFGKRSPGRK